MGEGHSPIRRQYHSGGLQFGEVNLNFTSNSIVASSAVDSDNAMKSVVNLNTIMDEKEGSKIGKEKGASSGLKKVNFLDMINEKNPKIKITKIKEFLESDINIQKSLFESKNKLKSLDLNPQYFLYIEEMPRVMISFLLEEVWIYPEEKMYKMKSFEKSKYNGFISYKDFLDIILIDYSTYPTKTITIRELFKQEGILDFIKNGLPLEREGRLNYNENDTEVVLEDITSNHMHSLIEIRLDKEGNLRLSAIGTNPLFDSPV